MPKLQRRDDGRPLRDAMARAGLSIPQLAEATRRVDPAGKGVAQATVGNLVGTGKTARGRCELTTAWLVAEALQELLDDLFIVPDDLVAAVNLKAVLRAAKGVRIPLRDLFAMPTLSTSTIERSRTDADDE